MLIHGRLSTNSCGQNKEKELFEFLLAICLVLLYYSGQWSQILPEGKALVVLYGIGFVLAVTRCEDTATLTDSTAVLRFLILLAQLCCFLRLAISHK